MHSCTKEFSWIGLPWACKKRRKHYQAYKRNGFQISLSLVLCFYLFHWVFLLATHIICSLTRMNLLFFVAILNVFRCMILYLFWHKKTSMLLPTWKTFMRIPEAIRWLWCAGFTKLMRLVLLCLTVLVTERFSFLFIFKIWVLNSYMDWLSFSVLGIYDAVKKWCLPFR